MSTNQPNVAPQENHEAAQPAADSLLDADGRVAIDLPCLRCGYNLRTLAKAAVCPECAYPVGNTTRSRYLWRSPPRWLERVAGGADMLSFSAIAGVVCAAGYAAVAMIAPDFGEALGPFAAGAGLILPLLVIFGLAGLTQRDPNLQDQPEGLSARRVIRWSLCLAPAIVLLAPLVIRPGGFVVLALLPAVIFLWLLIGIPIVVCRHLADLMRRASRPDLYRFARLTGWLVGGGGLFLVIVLAGSEILGSWPVVEVVLGVALAGVLGALVAVAVLLVRVARVLKEMRRQALEVAEDPVESAA